jgi:hypothetical protein
VGFCQSITFMHFNVSSHSAKLPMVYGTHQRLQAVPCYDYTNLMMYLQESVYGGGNCDTDGGPCCRSPSPENNVKQGLHDGCWLVAGRALPPASRCEIGCREDRGGNRSWSACRGFYRRRREASSIIAAIAAMAMTDIV